MNAKKPFRKAQCTPDHWQVSTETRINGRVVVEGTECSIRGESGRYRFQRAIRVVSGPNEGSEWLDFIGGAKGSTMFRSFHADRVRTVHYKNKLRESMEDS